MTRKRRAAMIPAAGTVMTQAAAILKMAERLTSSWRNSFLRLFRSALLSAILAFFFLSSARWIISIHLVILSAPIFASSLLVESEFIGIETLRFTTSETTLESYGALAVMLGHDASGWDVTLDPQNVRRRSVNRFLRPGDQSRGLDRLFRWRYSWVNWGELRGAGGAMPITSRAMVCWIAGVDSGRGRDLMMRPMARAATWEVEETLTDGFSAL